MFFSAKAYKDRQQQDGFWSSLWCVLEEWECNMPPSFYQHNNVGFWCDLLDIIAGHVKQYLPFGNQHEITGISPHLKEHVPIFIVSCKISYWTFSFLVNRFTSCLMCLSHQDLLHRTEYLTSLVSGISEVEERDPVVLWWVSRGVKSGNHPLMFVELANEWLQHVLVNGKCDTGILCIFFR